jgi:ABC-2 type transport system permease protein/oleandomycin transport system permease protein
VFAFIQPVMFVLLFRYVFGGAIRTPGTSYVDFLMPGVLVQTAMFGSFFTGIGLAEDLNKGVVDRLRSLPMARSAVLFGRTLSDLVRNAATGVVMVAVGILVGFRPDQSAPRLLLAIVVLLGFAYVFSWIAATIGLAIRDPETTQSAGFIWMFPLTFASSAFVPATSMPEPLKTFAQDVNPVTHAVDSVRALSLGGPLGDHLWIAFAWIAGLLIVFVPLAVRTYRRLQ